MKIVMTGGGTGGHFYPVIAVADELRRLMRERKMLEAKIYYLAPTPYSPKSLFDHNLEYRKIQAGKLRRGYNLILNFFDLFKTAWGVLKATILLFQIYPDVVFGKGGYTSFPILFAAKLFHIPVVIHESDSHPGRVNLWAAKFARAIAISYTDSAQYFPKNKTVYTGNPIRPEILLPITDGAYEFLKLEKDVPVILIVGGSQGAQFINENILDCLKDLVLKYQIIHQTGKYNYQDSVDRAKIILENNPNQSRYHPYEYLNELALRMAAGVSKLIISRAGSALFEIAAWGIPAIVVPIPEKISHDQRNNAYAYARSGAAMVIEQENLSPEIILSEIDRVLKNSDIYRKMQEAAKSFAKIDAAKRIAEEILSLALSH